MNTPNHGPNGVTITMLSRLFDGAPFRVYAKDLKHVFLYGNQAARRAHQVRKLVGKTDSDFFSEAYSQHARKGECDLISGKRKKVHEHSFERWKDRRLTLVEVFKFPLRDERGRVAGTWGISRELGDVPPAELPPPMWPLNPNIPLPQDSWLKEGYFYRITSTDREKRRSWFSDSFKKLYGWKSKIPTASQRRQLIHPEDRASVIEELRRAYRGDIEFYKKDFRMRTASGGGRYILVRSYGRIIHREKGGIVHFAGVHRDITNTKDTELVSELLLMKFPGYIFAKDSNRVFRYASPSLIRDLGLDEPEDILGKRDEAFFPADEVKVFKEADEQIILQGKSEVFRKEKVTTQEKTQDFYTVKIPIPGGIYSMGNRPGVLGFATKTSMILEDLEHKRLLWDTLMQDDSDVIFFKDNQGRYLEVNRAFEQLFKVSREMIARKHPPVEKVMKRLDSTMLKSILEEDQYILREHKPMYPDGIVRSLTVDGKLHRTLSRKLPVFDANGRVKGILGIARDITILERKQKELERLQEAARVIEKHVDSKLLPLLKRQTTRGGSRKIESKELTVMFCDIRGFSKFSKSLDQDLDALHSFLRDHYSMVVRVAHEHGAVVDKFIGDGAMLLGGLIRTNRSPAQDCGEMISLAIGLCRQFAEVFRRWNYRRSNVLDAELFLLHLGVGIHHGPVCVGNIKGEERDQYTAIGPTVNLAQRIESRAAGEISAEEKEQIRLRLKGSDRDLGLPDHFRFRDSVLVSQAVYRLLNEEPKIQEKLRPNPCLVDIKGMDGAYPVYGIEEKVLFPPGERRGDSSHFGPHPAHSG